MTSENRCKTLQAIRCAIQSTRQLLLLNKQKTRSKLSDELYELDAISESISMFGSDSELSVDDMYHGRDDSADGRSAVCQPEHGFGRGLLLIAPRWMDGSWWMCCPVHCCPPSHLKSTLVQHCKHIDLHAHYLTYILIFYIFIYSCAHARTLVLTCMQSYSRVKMYYCPCVAHFCHFSCVIVDLT